MTLTSLIFVVVLATTSVPATFAARASQPIATLQTVQVRPSVEQLQQRAHERASTIPTLSAVQVRPPLTPVAAVQREPRDVAGVPTLATVEVRPSAAQRAAIPTAVQPPLTSQDSTLALIERAIIHLPVPPLPLSGAELSLPIGTLERLLHD